MADRKRFTAREKEELRTSGSCYLCEALNLPHAGFDGYDAREIHMDHYQVPHGNVGSDPNAGQLAIHGAAGGLKPEDVGFEVETRRNCHAARGNRYKSKENFIRACRARMEARDAHFIDDVYENATRDLANGKYKLPISWHAHTATFMREQFKVITENRNGESWQRFLTTLRPDQLFTDATAQVRSAEKKAIHKMVDTFIEEGFPMFAPVNARVDKCGHVVIFDGNHRATSHTLAFGVEAPLPVMIWNIDSKGGCALRANLSSPSDGDDEE